MTDLIPIELEARLVGLSKQRRKDGDWIEVKFHIHPDEQPHALFILPLGTDCTLSIKGVPESAEEAPQTQTSPEAPDVPGKLKTVKEHRNWDDVSPREQACIRCNEPEFGKWLIDYLQVPPDSGIAPLVREYCRVASRANLNSNPAAARNWADLDEEYQDFIGQKRLEAQEQQLQDGRR